MKCQFYFTDILPLVTCSLSDALQKHYSAARDSCVVRYYFRNTVHFSLRYRQDVAFLVRFLVHRRRVLKCYFFIISSGSNSLFWLPSPFSSQTLNPTYRIYRVIQEELPPLTELTSHDILSKKCHINLGPMLNIYRVTFVFGNAIHTGQDIKLQNYNRAYGDSSVSKTMG
jgi:hypothetical protein